jgi:ADP-ribose pyrophosphatase YjhB (NUDIX family)
MVRPTYKDYWDIPGGHVREIKEELGLIVPVGRMFAVDWAPTEADGDKILFLFAGPELADDVKFHFEDGEIAEAKFVSLDELEHYTIDRLARRLRSAMCADEPEYLEHGRPVTKTDPQAK